MNPEARKRQLIKYFRTLTPEYRKLYREYKTLLNDTILSEFLCRLESARKLIQKHHFEKLTLKMDPLLKIVMLRQKHNAQKELKGRKFTVDEKLMCLSLNQQIPRSYEFLRKLFILPSKFALNKLIQVIKVRPAIRSQIFQLIKEEMANWSNKQKYCSIVFGQVPLKPHLTIESENEIQDLNQEKRSSNADYAMTFILHGAVKEWCQPVVFYDCEKIPSQPELISTIEDIVKKVVDIGLFPIALVTEPAFQPVINALQKHNQEQPTFENGLCDNTVNVSGITLNVIYNPRHLMEDIRNNFLTKNISLNDKIAKYSHIMHVYEMNCSCSDKIESRILRNVTDDHIIPEKIKMNAKDQTKYYCLQVFSRTMAALLAFSSNFDNLSSAGDRSMLDTSQVVVFFDSLYDSANGTKVIRDKDERKLKPVKTAVTRYTPHLKFWLEAIDKLDNMKFVNEDNEAVFVPALENWKITLKSLQNIVNFLRSKNVNFIYPGYFNCDSIDIFYDHVNSCNSWDDEIYYDFIKFKPLLITDFN